MLEKDFYKRQVILKEVGEEGQNLLKKARVCIIGAGGLGHPVTSYLAASGVGHILICDYDHVEVSNLHRQVLFTPEDKGKYKAEILAKKISEQNPFISVESLNVKIEGHNCDSILNDYDYIIDCTDNFRTKFLIHDFCYFLDKCLIQASIYQYEGQMQVFHYDKIKKSERGCLRCLWPKTPEKDCVGSCATAGVIGAVAGSFGTLQAMEVIKAILGITSIKHQQTLIFDLLSMEINKIKWPAHQDCVLCRSNLSKKEVLELNKDQQVFEISLEDSSSFVFLDIRDEEEVNSQLKITNINSRLLVEKTEIFIERNKDYIFVCTSGVRSLRLVKQLRDKGYENVFSLKNGLDGYAINDLINVLS